MIITQIVLTRANKMVPCHAYIQNNMCMYKSQTSNTQTQNNMCMYKSQTSNTQTQNSANELPNLTLNIT